MIYTLLWLLFGSLGLNILWMFHDKKHTWSQLTRGFLSGLVLGPLVLIFFIYLLIVED